MGQLYAYRDIVPTIAASAILFPTAEITGDVVIGERTIIGAGVKIIGDSHGPVRIGNDVQILENTVLHLLPDNDLIIDDGAVVGPGAMIHGCRIGAGSVDRTGRDRVRRQHRSAPTASCAPEPSSSSARSLPTVSRSTASPQSTSVASTHPHGRRGHSPTTSYRFSLEVDTPNEAGTAAATPGPPPFGLLVSAWHQRFPKGEPGVRNESTVRARVGSSEPNDVGFEARRAQYSPLITKYEPRIVPASFDFCRANLNEPSSAGHLHPFGELEPDRSLLRFVERVQHVDREPALVEHVGPPDVLDLEGRRLEWGRSDDDVALLLEDRGAPSRWPSWPWRPVRP